MRRLTAEPKGYATEVQILVTEDRLTFAQVGSGFVRLREVVAAIAPDLLFGINRGGAAVGGMLGKSTGQMIHVLEVDYGTESRGRVLDGRALSSGEVRRVVLLDDVVRSGSHMELASRHLQERFPSAVIHRLCLLEVRTDADGRRIDWAPYLAYGEGRTPWEP